MEPNRLAEAADNLERFAERCRFYSTVTPLLVEQLRPDLFPPGTSIYDNFDDDDD